MIYKDLSKNDKEAILDTIAKAGIKLNNVETAEHYFNMLPYELRTNGVNWGYANPIISDHMYDAFVNIAHKESANAILTERQIIEALWDLLDNIDTLSDICKPTLNDPKALMAFYNNTMKYAGERFKYMQSDGHKLYTNEEFNNTALK